MNLEISTWLSAGGSYEAGVALYAQHGASRVVKRMLAGAQTDYTREVLVRELTALVATAPVGINSAPERYQAKPARDAPAAPAQSGGTDAGLPEYQPTPALQQLKQQRQAAFADRDYLRARLELVATDAERLQMALHILAHADVITRSYDVERHYQQHGTLPEAPAAPAPAAELATLSSRAEIQYHLKLLRTRRSKLQDREDRAADYAQVLADIDLLETKLSR